MRWCPLIAPLALLAVGSFVSGCGSSHSIAGTATTAQATVTDTQVAKVTSTESGVTPTKASISTNYVAPVYTIQFAQPLARYTAYVEHLAEQLPGEVSAIQSAASRGDLTGAEAAWLKAHVTYLKIGQDDAAYGSFGDLGQQIDGLADGLPNTTANPKFTGFHKIELDLWRRHDGAAAATDSAQLLKFVKELTPKVIVADLPLKTLPLDAWVLRCHEILEDGLRDSLSGDDDYGSNSDLASLAADVDATREMLKVLAPLISTRAPSIVPYARAELANISIAITGAGGSDAHRSLASLAPRQRQQIDADTSVALEQLAPVSELMQVTAPGS